VGPRKLKFYPRTVERATIQPITELGLVKGSS
jgi:hypothetical protein